MIVIASSDDCIIQVYLYLSEFIRKACNAGVEVQISHTFVSLITMWLLDQIFVSQYEKDTFILSYRQLNDNLF